MNCNDLGKKRSSAHSLICSYVTHSGSQNPTPTVQVTDDLKCISIRQLKITFHTFVVVYLGGQHTRQSLAYPFLSPPEE